MTDSSIAGGVDVDRPIPMREKILEAAAQCIERYSLRRTTVEEVCRLSGISRQTVYRHFRNRDEMISAVSTRKALEVTQFVERTIADSAGPRARIVDAIVACVQFIVTDRQMIEMVDGSFEGLIARTSSPGIVAVTRDRWLPILNEGVEAGIIAPSMDMHRLITWITYVETVMAMRVHVLGLSIDRIREEVETFVLDGIISRAEG